MNIISNELIPVYDNNGNQAVNTRELYEYLGVGKAYSDWFKYRSEQNGYVEGEDFIPFWGESTGGRQRMTTVDGLSCTTKWTGK